LGTEGLMTRIQEDHPDIRISLGGGISTIDEVNVLKTAGAHHVLVGSALHDGRIGRRQLANLKTAED
jgi:phosphoribosylformimino-5-aminoimidazole carboxamide ribotide isomerase